MLRTMCIAMLFAAGTTWLPGQDDSDLGARETKLNTAATRSLLAFARTAASCKMFARAHAANQLIVAHYDPDNRGALAALAKDERVDQGSLAERRSVDQAWSLAIGKLAPEHRELGLAFAAQDDLLRATHHLQRCIALDPTDAAAHAALGHESHNGYYGPPEQIEFLQRLAAIEARAKELAATDYAPTALPADEMPEELRRASIGAVGARTRSWKVWTTSGDAQVAGDIAQWAERAQELLEFLMPSGPMRRGARIDSRPVQWVAVVRNDEEWEAFFRSNPDILTAAKLTGTPGSSWFRFRSQSGEAEIFRHHVEMDADNIIAHVAMWGFANRNNEGLGQGLVHTLTSLLVGSMHTWFGAEPKTRASPAAPLPRDLEHWSVSLREEIRRGGDMPAAQVPRERLSNFRETVRRKSWSFVYWLVARYPQQWNRPFQALISEKNPMPEDVDAVFQRELGRSLGELEAEWREWARGDSAIAKASGHGG